MNEARMLLIDRASREQGRLVHFTLVLDLEDWSVVGNSDRAWTAFTTEKTRPIGETYHDCNSMYVAIRTTRWARMAYGVVKPLLPKKVTEKIHLLDDHFDRCPLARRVLGARTLALLARRHFGDDLRRHTGREVIQPRKAFDLTVEVPAGSSLRWRFAVSAARDARCGCFAPPLPAASGDLAFSVGAAAASMAGPGAQRGPLPPRRVKGDALVGWLGAAEAGEGPVTFCWDNRHAWVTPKALIYTVEVVPPTAAEPGSASWPFQAEAETPQGFGAVAGVYRVVLTSPLALLLLSLAIVAAAAATYRIM
mmetsp:Transcript_64132/g.177290  ORF Transcript_64132/g.177290 Transcript_64132/m.177290 type:complete len:308 (+) Transcript_64132:1-924(+)